MNELVVKQHSYFREGHSREITFRKSKLRQLKSVLQANEENIYEALQADLRKPAFEVYETELFILYQEIDELLGNLSSWAAPKKVSGGLINRPSQNYVHPQPYGVALIIGAWNYPLQLLLNPALPSIAAGNSTILKPSEHASHTSQLLEEMINSNFESEFLHVVEGEAETTKALLDEPLDYIFFTGSSNIGKKVMHAAADQLTPLTLELGGKSPAIIDETADLEMAARRICWGKFINAGQTCVSPDYVYVHESIKKEFISLLKSQIHEFYGDDPAQSPDYARIINRKHFHRLSVIIEDSKTVIGGNADGDDLYIEPSILPDADWESPAMQEEVFGPILPVLSYKNLNTVTTKIKDYPKPLALYLFSNDSETQEQIINEVPFGGGCINDTVAHLANLELPFGGIGNSGFGSYHGKAGFDTFSHHKSIMKKTNWPEVPLRYPPYDGNMKWFKRLTSWF